MGNGYAVGRPWLDEEKRKAEVQLSKAVDQIRFAEMKRHDAIAAIKAIDYLLYMLDGKKNG